MKLFMALGTGMQDGNLRQDRLETTTLGWTSFASTGSRCKTTIGIARGVFLCDLHDWIFDPRHTPK